MPRRIAIFALPVTQNFQEECYRNPPLARKLVHVVIPQTRQDEFVQQFLIAFLKTDWSSHKSGDHWPAEVHGG